MTGIAISTCPSGRPPSLDTFPVMVTGPWAGALATTSMPSAAAANTLRTMRRMMDPPGRRGTGGLRVSATLRGGSRRRYENATSRDGGATTAVRRATTRDHKTKTRCDCTGLGRSGGVAVPHDARRLARAKRRAQRDRPPVSEGATEPGFEVLAVAARQLERGAVVQDHHVLPAEERLELLHLLEVHDGRPVDPDEAARVELTIEVLHRLAQQVPGLTDVDAHVVPLRVDPFDFAYGQERHLPARLDEQSIEIPRASGPRRLPVAEQGRQLLGQLPQTAVAHLQLRALQRLSEALVGDHDLRVGREQVPYSLTRGELVVHDQGANRSHPINAHEAPCQSAAAKRNGTTMCAIAPPSPAFTTSNDASSPYSCRKRALVLVRPTPRFSGLSRTEASPAPSSRTVRCRLPLIRRALIRSRPTVLRGAIP